MKLRVAVIIKRFVTTGGAERYAYELTRRIARDHEVHVFAHEWDFHSEEKIIFHKLKNPINRPTWLKQWIFSLNCMKAIEKERFDIVHTHEKIFKFDIMTIHSPCFRSYLTNKKGILKAIKTLTTIFSIRKIAWLLLEWIQFRYDSNKFFIAVSENVMENVINNYGLKNSSFRIIYPGVEISDKLSPLTPKEKGEMRRRYGVEPDDTVYLFVGSEFKRKGLDTLLYAFSILEDPNSKLLVVGDGGGRLRDYREKVRNYGLEGRVRFLGLVKDPHFLYGISDALILPTLSDPSPLVPIEAMAHGLPVAMSEAQFCGASEHIKAGEAILIKNPLDPYEVKSALLSLSQRDISSALSQKGRALAERLNWDSVYKETLSVYQEVVERKRENL